jgi:hemerythrin-like domain-containing protein
MSEKPQPNIGVDLLRIHRVITRGLAVSQEYCQSFVEGGFPDDATREGFWRYCHGLEAIAHAHHEAEDDLFFPYLRERVPDADFDELTAEHQEMQTILDEMQAARDAGSLADLGPALSRMAELWHPHIEKEETVFSPEIAAEVMTVPEHIDMAQKVGAHSQEHLQPAPLAIPFMLYNVEGDDRAYFMAVLPPEVTQQLVPIVWKDEWAPMKPFLLD